MDRLLIWDIDGTLIRMKGLGKRAMNMAFKELYGINNALDYVNMAGALDSMILKSAFGRYSISNDKAEYNKYVSTYLRILEAEAEKIDSSITCPGIVKLLETLCINRDSFNVIGTGNMERGARIKLSIGNLNRFFPTGAFGDREMERRQLIEEAISNSRKFFDTDFAGKDTYVIGDTPIDIKSSKAAGTMAVGVATGPYSSSQLLECGADFVFEDLSDIRSFLKIFEGS